MNLVELVEIARSEEKAEEFLLVYHTTRFIKFRLDNLCTNFFQKMKSFYMDR